MTVWRPVTLADAATPSAPEASPRRARLQITLAALAALVLLIAVAVVPASGLVSARIVTGSGAVASPRGDAGPHIGLYVANDGWTTATLTSVELATPGLSGGSWFVPGRRPDTPIRLVPHHGVELNIAYRHLDCAALARGTVRPLVFHVRTVLGLSSSLRIAPLGYRSPTGGALGWSAGATWATCHPGTRLPAALP